MKFSDIAGHEEIKQRLRSMADSGHLPHALLIEGPTGIGKLALARAFAQYIHCSAPTADGEPCGRCSSCRQHQAFNHIDTFYVFPVVKSEKSTTPPVSDEFIDQWREYLGNHIYVSPSDWAGTFTRKNARPTHYVTQGADLIRRMALTANGSKYKIVIFWQPEAMQPATANKILKLVEEPFPDTLFIMVSENAGEILPTIYSRLQRVKVRRYDDATVTQYLFEHHQSLDASQAEAIAHIAEGSILSAEHLVDTTTRRHRFFDMFVQLMRLAYQRNVGALRKWSDVLADDGKDINAEFYVYTIRMMRENFMLPLNVPQITYLNVEENKFCANFARFITARNVERLIGHFEKAIVDINANGNRKLVNFDVALKVILLIKSA